VAILGIFRARVIWPEYPTLLTMILFLLALTSVAMLVDTIRQGKPLPRPQGSSPLRLVLIVIAAVTTFYTLVGLLVITPSRYYSYYVYVFWGRWLPEFILRWVDEWIVLVVIEGPGFWIFAIVSGILWYIISRHNRSFRATDGVEAGRKAGY
jgi:hypothetical protein